MLSIRERQITADIETIKTLSGLSGCEVALLRRDEHYFVRKTSASRGYNERLQQQIDKQTRLSALVRTPAILANGSRDGLLFFDMEFVQGRDFKTFLPLNNVIELPAFVDRLLDAMARLARIDRGKVPVAAFQRKIDSVHASLEASEFARPCKAELDEAFRALRSVDLGGIPWTECHGDLTLENIIVEEDGSLTFIDLLDGELESVWLDLAKLIHDLECGWTFRNALWHDALSPQERLIALLNRYLREELEVRAAMQFPGFARYRIPLQMLQAMRVLPYVADAKTFDRLRTQIGLYRARMQS